MDRQSEGSKNIRRLPDAIPIGSARKRKRWAAAAAAGKKTNFDAQDKRASGEQMAATRPDSGHSRAFNENVRVAVM